MSVRLEFSQQKTFGKGVIGIHDKLMIPGNLGVSPNLAHDAGKFSDGHGFDDAPFEHRAQGAGIFVYLVGSEFSPVMEQGHLGRGAGAAR